MGYAPRRMSRRARIMAGHAGTGAGLSCADGIRAAADVTAGMDHGRSRGDGGGFVVRRWDTRRGGCHGGHGSWPVTRANPPLRCASGVGAGFLAIRNAPHARRNPRHGDCRINGRETRPPSAMRNAPHARRHPRHGDHRINARETRPPSWSARRWGAGLSPQRDVVDISTGRRDGDHAVDGGKPAPTMRVGCRGGFPRDAKCVPCPAIPT
jgi:hypothetical protein